MTRITTHPGEMLKHEFLIPMNLSASALARSMHVPANRITELVNGRRDITGDTALRLERVLGVSAEFWMRLQASHDLTKAKAARTYDDLERLSA
jgi:addiction module HigA family antidote